MKIKLVHKDVRGSTYSITGRELCGLPEVALFYTKQGYARGGCVHYGYDEDFLLLKGEIHFFDDKTTFALSSGESFHINKGTAHGFKALTDCVCMEVGVPPEHKGDKDKRMHEKIARINEKNRADTSRVSDVGKK